MLLFSAEIRFVLYEYFNGTYRFYSVDGVSCLKCQEVSVEAPFNLSVPHIKAEPKRNKFRNDVSLFVASSLLR